MHLVGLLVDQPGWRPASRLADAARLKRTSLARRAETANIGSVIECDATDCEASTLGAVDFGGCRRRPSCAVLRLQFEQRANGHVGTADFGRAPNFHSRTARYKI